MPVASRTSVVTSYAESVIEGTLPACRLVRQACERHLRDIEHGHERGLHFDDAAAEKVIKFFGFLKQSKGEWAGKGLTLQPWQEFIIGSVFGWKRADGFRRFRTVYIEVPRKNGKSTLSAGVGLYLLMADGEPGAEIYSAATHRDQARIVHEEAVAMVKASEALRSRIGIFRDNLHIDATRSKYEPLGADADTMDGLNIHGVIVDELHAHKSRAMWNVLDTATGARRQPLIWAVTTAGWDRHSICWEQHQYSEQVLSTVIDDDAHFCYLAGTDPGDDWRSPSTWAKANPSLGVSVKLDDLTRKATKAAALPSEQNAFKRLHLDIWTEQAERWLDIVRWDACREPTDLASLAARVCYAGLDLSSTLDITALVLLFPLDDGRVRILSHFWLPADNMRQRVDRDHVPYDVWASQGYITLTNGNVIDYDFILEECKQLATLYQFRRFGYDPYNATQLVLDLQKEGFEMIPVRQGFLGLNAPTKDLEARVMGRRIIHDGNPVLRWMVSNVAIERDAAGNLKPAKDKSTEKIDGVLATIIALDQLSRGGEDEVSPYEVGRLLIL